MSAPLYLVAIVQLATTVDAEARALVADLGGVAYDHRMKLAGGVPAVMLSTPDPEAARTCVNAIRARGHEAIVINTANIAPSRPVRTVDFDALVHEGITVLVRAIHRKTMETTKVTTEKKFSATRAVLTGGLKVNKTTTTTTTSHAFDNEAVLYVFGAPGSAPWLISEQHVRYDALGAAATPHSAKNFEMVIAELCRRVPSAVFDDRLVPRKEPPGEIDQLAHVIARTAATSPYR